MGVPQVIPLSLEYPPKWHVCRVLIAELAGLGRTFQAEETADAMRRENTGFWTFRVSERIIEHLEPREHGKVGKRNQARS